MKNNGIDPMSIVWFNVIKPVCSERVGCHKCKFWSEGEYRCLFRLLCERIEKGE